MSKVTQRAMPNYQKFFSETALARRPSPIRVLTKIQMDSGPDMISLAGGMPNPAKFPIDGLSIGVSGESRSIPAAMVAQGLQYAPSKGLPTFVQQLNHIRQTYHGVSPHEDDIDCCVTVGSQNGLEMLLGSIISNGDGILVDDPIYPGTKAILRPLGAEMIAVETDENGMDMDSLVQRIEQYQGKVPLKAIITVANGGNPTGSTLSLDRRHRLLAIAEEYDLLIIEDDPYYFLQFEGDKVPSLFELDWNSVLTKMKFTAAAALIGTSQAITLWTTRGEIAYFEADDVEDTMNLQLNDWHPGQHEMLGAAAYERVFPARF